MEGRRLRCYGCALLVLMVLAASSEAGAAESTSSSQDEESKSSGWPFDTRGSIGLTAVFVDINGSQAKYRSDYNYLPGFVLSDFSLELLGESGSNGWMDYLRLDGSGFGDAYPFQQAMLHFGKRGSYEFRGRYWKQEYFFNLPSYGLGGHSDDSARRVTDLSLRLFPHRKVTVELGYQRNYNYGTSFGSQEFFRNLFELGDPRRALTQDFRLGLEVDHGGAHFAVFQSFRRFKEDPEQSSSRLLDDAKLPDAAVATPVRQSVPSTQLLARYAPSETWSLEGKYVFSDGHVDAEHSEFIGLDLAEGITLEQIAHANSVSDRPEHRAEATGSFFLHERLEFTNTFEFHTFDVTGDLLGNVSLQSPAPGSGTIDIPLSETTDLNYRTLRDEPTLEFFLHPRFSVYGGYRYSSRLFEDNVVSERQATISHTGLAGATWRPYSGARLSLAFEKGTANDAFTRIEPRSVTRWRFTSRFPVGSGLTVSPHFLISDRDNRDSGADYAADQRQFGFDLSYVVQDEKLVVTAGYTLFDLETIADIRFFLGREEVDDLSRYSTQLHFFRAHLELPFGSRLRFRLGYQGLNDPSDSSFPLTRHQGEAGLSLRTGRDLTWGLNWSHVSYNEKLSSQQDYMANRLELTLGWSF